MFEILWHFIDITVPWWLKGLIAAVLVAVLLAVFRAYWRYILAGAAVVGGAILLNRAKQQGYTDRRAEEEKALDKAEEIHGEIEKKVEALPATQLDTETDRWSRK